MPGLLNRYFQAAWRYAGELLPSRNVVEILGHASIEDDPDSQTTKITILGNRVADLPAAEAVTGSQLVQVSDGAVDRKATVSQIGAAIDVNGTAGILSPAKGGTGVAATSGIVRYSSGVGGLVTAPAGDLVGTTAAQTLTNKTLSMGSSWVAFGATPAGSGDVRVTYAGGGSRNVVVVKNSAAVDTPIVRTGPGDACTWGNSSLDFSLAGVQGFLAFTSVMSLKSVALTAMETTAAELFVGTSSGYATQFPSVRIYATTSVNFGVGSTTVMQATGGLLYLNQPIVNTGLCEVNGLRLTLSTGNPVPTADVASSSTIYLTPHRSGSIALCDASGFWAVRTTGEVSQTFAGMTPGSNYDVFAYWSGSAVVLERAIWTDATTRATALARQDGVLVKAGDRTRRYLGTFRATSATTTADTATQRLVYNDANQVDRHLLYSDTGASWSYASATIRQARGSTANRLEFVLGSPAFVSARGEAQYTPGSLGPAYFMYFGLDSTTTPANESRSITFTQSAGATTITSASYESTVPAGYHALNYLENSTTGASITVQGGGTTGNNIRARIRM